MQAPVSRHFSQISLPSAGIGAVAAAVGGPAELAIGGPAAAIGGPAEGVGAAAGADDVCCFARFYDNSDVDSSHGKSKRLPYRFRELRWVREAAPVSEHARAGVPPF